jgi:uncharacterized protein (UPF0147 family)
MMAAEQYTEILGAIGELLEDSTLPKGMKGRLEIINQVLQEEETEHQLKMSKVLAELDEVANDANLDPYFRTQVWNLSSMLESLNA